MDEKGCRLTLHHQQTVIAQKGAKRVHMQGSEHGENVTVVGCANAIGYPIPLMIIFKGKRKKPEYEDNLPAGSIDHMAPKGSMTTELFIVFIEHLAYKTPGKCLLIFDGAKCHLDFRIAETAEKYDNVLYCLPSNTTHDTNYNLLTKLVTSLLNLTGIKKFCNICTKRGKNRSLKHDLT